ncbi:hypothetical protein DNTS_012289 [Danionella cerebrum]|uniref:SAP domain-containing protein n=1 Tax=Danionella cerebrum TaxID=2873325 RepID=A0A553MX23_9TELE|nr:hypothetical protein DNTS_012289 [Danionella translucida]TRY57730.1 hypothetical protein DNTS_012289 [Danionella translucida]
MLETSSWLLTDAAPFRAAPVSSGMKNEAVRLGREGQACLSLREVLQLKLQQRRTREELVKQGIMPPLKSSASFNEQRRSLERARVVTKSVCVQEEQLRDTEDYLKRKIRCRPERSELVRRHILEESSAEPSLQAKQLLLKRARLADDLNDKISQRPGPMELVHKNILPVHCNMKQTITADADNSSLDEESSDAFSPEQMLSPLSQGHQHSPPETQTMDSTQAPPPLQTPLSSHTPSQKPANGTAGQKKPPALQKAGKVSTERTALRSKRIRDSKPKVKKLKYHQYVPPDQKTEHGPPPPPQLDSSYTKLLHQQQLFLQLQIINQQQNYNYHSILPAPPKPAADLKTPKIEPCPQTTSSNMNGHNQQTPSNVAAVNAGSLPSNLDELKVAELKQELKLRGLTVSGTKNGLIERLKNFQEQNSAITRVLTFKTKAASSPVIGGAYSTDSITPTSFRFSATSEKSGAKICSTSSSPPLSPAHSERSSTGMSPDEGSCHGDAFGEMVSSPLTQLSLQHSPPVVRIKQEPDSGESSSHCCMLEPQMDKDQMLREKDQRIRELTLMLLQKQQLVQSLRLQLQASPTGTSEDLLRVCVKEEDVDMLEERVAERQCMLGRAEVEQQQLVMKQNLKNVQQQTQQRTRTAPKTQFNSDKQVSALYFE